jgi:hypothetical protein
MAMMPVPMAFAGCRTMGVPVVGWQTMQVLGAGRVVMVMLVIMPMLESLMMPLQAVLFVVLPVVTRSHVLS